MENEVISIVCNCEYCKHQRNKSKPEPRINYFDWLMYGEEPTEEDRLECK